MSSQFSVTEDASLFGLDVELDVYLSKLEAANVFSRIRKEIDRNVTALKTLTPREFGKRRTMNTFRDNVELVVNGTPESRVLMPLVEKLGSSDSVINILILACFTLSKTTYKHLTEHNLTDVFAEFLTCIINDCTIFSSMRETFIEVIKDVCQKNNGETSNKLLGLFCLLCLHYMLYRLTCLGAVDVDGGSQKRRRLDPPSPRHSTAQQNEGRKRTATELAVRGATSMSETGTDALGGKQEHISGLHTFTVEDQTRVIASGVMIMIFGQGQSQARWHGKDTGVEGQTVSEGERVRVYNADVEFKK